MNGHSVPGPRTPSPEGGEEEEGELKEEPTMESILALMERVDKDIVDTERVIKKVNTELSVSTWKVKNAIIASFDHLIPRCYKCLYPVYHRKRRRLVC